MVLNLIGFFGGFFVSSLLDSTLGDFGEWAIVGAAFIIATAESFSNCYYTTLRKFKTILDYKYAFMNLLLILNYFKIGLIYGLIVDAFKLGS